VRRDGSELPIERKRIVGRRRQAQDRITLSDWALAGARAFQAPRGVGLDSRDAGVSAGRNAAVVMALGPSVCARAKRPTGVAAQRRGA